MSDETKIRTGGLYRCCIATIEEKIFLNSPTEGDIIDCEHCNESMIYTDGAWEWKNE